METLDRQTTVPRDDLELYPSILCFVGKKFRLQAKIVSGRLPWRLSGTSCIIHASGYGYTPESFPLRSTCNHRWFTKQIIESISSRHSYWRRFVARFLLTIRILLRFEFKVLHRLDPSRWKNITDRIRWKFKRRFCTSNIRRVYDCTGGTIQKWDKFERKNKWSEIFFVRNFISE